MGRLRFPDSGVVCVDTSAVIYAAEKIEPYVSLLAPLWSRAAEGAIQLVGSELLLLECLVAPVKEGDSELESLYRELLTNSLEFKLLPISARVLEAAVDIRANHGLRTPDAIHAATAKIAGCAQFVTNDRQFGRIVDLPVAMLADSLE